jgi:hypothetical protein
VPLTIFFEVEEYLAFMRERSSLTRLLGYDPAAEIRNQILDLARRGHDIQLHLHPEWVGASFVDDRWILRPEKSSVDTLFETKAETAQYIAERKLIIDDLLAQAGRGQRVSAYRAGAFCAQPGEKLLHALTENGFILDSSVVKGMRRNDRNATFDFSSSPERRRHWFVRDDVAREDATGTLYEVPIYSRMGRRFHQLTPKRLTAKFSRKVPKAKQLEMVEQLRIGRTPLSIARFLLQCFPIKLDFHNMTSRQMLRWIQRAAAPVDGDEDVIVLIGHTKEHTDDTDFARFLARVKKDPTLEVITMTELSRRLRSLSKRRNSIATITAS